MCIFLISYEHDNYQIKNIENGLQKVDNIYEILNSKFYKEQTTKTQILIIKTKFKIYQDSNSQLLMNSVEYNYLIIRLLCKRCVLHTAL